MRSIFKNKKLLQILKEQELEIANLNYENMKNKQHIKLLKVGVLAVKEVAVDNHTIYRVGWDNAFVEAIKKEAFKEFTKRLKEKYSQDDFLCPRKIISLTEMELDKFYKKLVGEDNGSL